MNEQTQLLIDKLSEILGEAADFSGEVMLLDWRKSTAKDGPKLTILLQDDDAIRPFEVATTRKGKVAGQLYYLFAIRLDETKIGKLTPTQSDTTAPAARVPGGNQIARQLHTSGYFRNPKLWAAMEREGLYTQATHREWIRAQPCHGLKVAPQIPCSGEVCGHHVASATLPAAGSGPTPNKVPDWYEVPLCHAHHTTWAHGSWSGGATREDKEALLQYAITLTADQMKASLKFAMGLDTLADVTQEDVDNWEAVLGLA